MEDLVKKARAFAEPILKDYVCKRTGVPYIQALDYILDLHDGCASGRASVYLFEILAEGLVTLQDLADEFDAPFAIRCHCDGSHSRNFVYNNVVNEYVLEPLNVGFVKKDEYKAPTHDVATFEFFEIGE